MQNADSQGEYVPTLQHLFFLHSAFKIFHPGDPVALSLSLSDRSCCSSFSVCRSFSMVCCRAARSSCHRFRLLCFQSSFWKARSPVPVPVSRSPPCRPLQRWVFTLAAVFQAEERLCPSGLWQPLLPGLVDVCWNHAASLVSPWAGQSAALGPCEFCTTGTLRKSFSESGPAASAPCKASTDGGSPSPPLQRADWVFWLEALVWLPR